MGTSRKSKLSEWQSKASRGGMCEKCLREISYLTVDHIVPMAIVDMLDDTGVMKYDMEENFQLLCHPCNKFKAARLDKTNPKTIKILSDLLKA